MKTLFRMMLAVMLMCCLTANAQLEELNGKNISVGEPATELEYGQWYLMKNVGRNAYIKHESDGTLMMRPIIDLNGTYATENCGYLMRFVRVGGTQNFYIQTGRGEYMNGLIQTSNKGDNNGTSVTASVQYTSGVISSGHYYFRDCSTNLILDGNAVNGSLAGWGTTAPTTTGGNNDYQLLPVNLYTPVVVTFDSAKKYTLRTAVGTYLALDEQDNDGSANKTATAAHYSSTPSQFTITANGNKFNLADENGHMLGVSTAVFWNVSNTSSYDWTIEPVEDTDNGYTIRCEHGYLNGEGSMSAGGNIYTNKPTAATWYIEEYAPKSEQITDLSQIESGHYYRFVNVGASTKAMNETDGQVRGDMVSERRGSQVWKLVGNSTSGYTFQNLFTGNYIQASTSTNVNNPYSTASNVGKAFKLGVVDASNAYFYIEGNTSSNGLNYNNAYNSVQNWQWATDPGSQWTIYEVLNTDELQGLADDYNAVKNLTTSQLLTYFSDYACTALKPNYASKTDAELRQAMSSMPTAVQDMAVAVKNQTWNAAKDETYNRYEKNFRIADYEVYTNRNWNQITKVGPFAMLYNPTGVTVTDGQTIMVMVGEDAKDSDAEILLHIASDTHQYDDQTQTLRKGLNIVMAESSGEVFIDYTLNNAPNGAWNGKTVSQYPNVKVHIEGGQCTGMWDMHRGMTNDDWTWLTKNMFGAQFLHVKGHSTLMNVLTDQCRSGRNVEEVLTAWDFVFDTEESLTGCDQWRKTGAYKPLINPRNSYSGNPNWSGNYGTNHPGLSISENTYQEFNQIGQNGGAMWVISHEEGHAHQYPIKLAGTTEQTNNSLANCVNLLWNMRDNVTQPRSDRHDGVKALLKRYNENGYSWIDYAGQRDCDDGYSSLWIANKWFYQLWLYFDFLGNYQPEGGNDGFAFVSELCNRMRASGIQTSSNYNNPASSSCDFLQIARHASDIAKADLSEYFEVWGFFKTTPAVANNEAPADNPDQHDYPQSKTWFLGDYGSYFIQTSDDDAQATKQYIKEHYAERPLSNLIFIEGRGGDDDTWLTYNNQPAKSFGETGFYRTYMNGVLAAYNYTLTDNTVTMTGGRGAVGFKVYDLEGNLLWLSNFNSFTLSSEVATKLRNGQAVVKVASGTGRDLAIGEVEDLTIGTLAKKVWMLGRGYDWVTPASVRTVGNQIIKR